MWKSKKPLLVFLILMLFGLLLLALDFYGFIWHNAPFAAFYKIKGLDVSHHQGVIDWPMVASTGKYSFVYIKATEGHDFTDDHFSKNWKEAKENGLKVGAYHFFSLRSSGQEQAEYFIKYVPREENALPPVIDIEIDATKDPAKVRSDIEAMSNALEKHYQQKPILYLTYATYNAYVKDHFQDSPIWIRDVLKYPHLTDRKWIMWQYSNRGRVEGINTLVDINVFNGSDEDFRKLNSK